MPEVCEQVIYGDGEGEEHKALIRGVIHHPTNVLRPWLTLVIVDPNPNATCTSKGVTLRKDLTIHKVPHKAIAGPGEYWREPE